MKIRSKFISNSSASSFMITNKSDLNLDLVDFVLENPQLVEEWNARYGYQHTQEELVESAGENNITFDAHSKDEYIFGDEDGTLVGWIFDYILRDGGSSENFEWEFFKFYR